MRRLLLGLGLAAGALALSTPADAVCQGGSRAGVCVTVIECARICRVHVVVDPYCNQGHPAIGACTTIDNLYFELPS